MSETRDLPPLFEGATHRLAGSGEPVKAVQWLKDGDHPKVVRYPIERREFKGLLRAAPKRNFALRFGEWIIEDAKGRIYVESSQTLPARYQPLADGPSPAGAAVIAAICAIVSFIFGTPSDIPLLLGVTHLMYYSILQGQWNGTTNSVLDLDEAADDMRVSAHTNTYSINQDTHNFFDDLTNEVTGTNYTAGGAAIGSQTLNRSTNTVTFDGADIVWTQSGAGFSNARKFVVYRFNATPGNAPLFSVVTADADVGNVTGDLTIAWSASGIATWTTT